MNRNVVKPQASFRTVQRPAGFTLIELLVVISIIALLIGILLPALGKARAAGQAVSCLSNSRQMCVAINTYATDNNNLYPDHYGYRTNIVSNENQLYPSGWSNVAQYEQPGGQSATGPVEGYVQWSGVLIGNGYLTGVAFACPAQSTQGWAPTFYSDGNTNGNPVDAEGYQQFCSYSPPGTINGGAGVVTIGSPAPVGTPPQIDSQAQRLSYIGNEAIMPRGKSLVCFDPAQPTAGPYSYAGGTAPNAVYVRTDEVDKAAGTICVAENTDYFRQYWDHSGSSGDGIKTHRPAHAVVYASSTGTPGGFWDGENVHYVSSTGAIPGNMPGVTYALAITAADAQAGFDSFKKGGTNYGKTMMNAGAWSGASNSITGTHVAAGGALASVAGSKGPLLMYTSPDRHNGQANYCFCDGHAAAQTLTQCLDPTNWEWGLKMYTTPDKFVVLASPGSLTPVQ